MSEQTNQKRDYERVVQIVSDAGGRVVGRTKLQKIAYLLEATGLGDGFSFEYRHYGPYSDELSLAARSAKLLGVLEEEECTTNWGGFYSVYTASVGASGNSARSQLAKVAVSADAIELELAATAAFLAREGNIDPWGETARRKPEKATDVRVAGAKKLYERLELVQTPNGLPTIA